MNISAHKLFPAFNPSNLVGEIKSKITIKIKRSVVFTVLLGSVVGAIGQPPPRQTDPLMQLMMTQPQIDVSSPVEARAEFDPPVVRVGETATYRVSFTALKDSIAWPEKITAPPRLQLNASARGEILPQVGNKLKPLTSFNHRALPLEAGTYSVPEFAVEVYGKGVTVPAATLTVLPKTAPAPPPAARLVIEPGPTNVFTGQPVPVRVVMAASVGNMIPGMTQMKINGDGFLTDNSGARQSISMQPRNGTNVAVYAYETVLIPLTTGELEILAQGFTTGSQFGGPVLMQGQVMIPGDPAQFVLLDSDPVTLWVNPLPSGGRLPGFTGFIGSLDADPPVLATNRARVGDPVKLAVTFRSQGSLARFVPPPAPLARDWQMFPPTSVAATSPHSVSYVFTMTPLTNGMLTTPRIPFSYFDPQRAAYVDLSLPGVSLSVTNAESTVDVEAWLLANTLSDSGKKKTSTLSPLATSQGRTATSLVPMQMRADFFLLLLSPLVVFGALSAWDRRRRFLEQHPEIARRQKARRALRRERRALDRAGSRSDAKEFATRAVVAMRVACAPHFPAEPRALVGSDVLSLLDETSRNGRPGEGIRSLFAVTDESQFGGKPADLSGLLQLRPELNHVLDELEARL